MRYIKLLLSGFLGLLIITTIIGLFMPASVKVTRGVILKADSAKVDLFLSDLLGWDTWMPWKSNAQGLKTTARVVAAKQGSYVEWRLNDGNSIARIHYLGRQPGIIQLHHVFKEMNPSDGGFRLRSLDDGTTEVQWFLEYPLKWYPWERFYGIFMDAMIGSVLEKGLQNMSALI
jgi:hypothetical protein